MGATRDKVLHYPGLKEEIYLGDFEPDAEILEKVGVGRASDTVVVVMRAPPTGATYHQFDNPLYERLLERVARTPSTTCIVLARHPGQWAALRGRRLANCIVPETAVDSRSLLYASDCFIGAGGTMTREAALIGHLVRQHLGPVVRPPWTIGSPTGAC
jgi:predicted glycosyltransferase